jgi:hypothetical protein
VSENAGIVPWPVATSALAVSALTIRLDPIHIWLDLILYSARSHPLGRSSPGRQCVPCPFIYEISPDYAYFQTIERLNCMSGTLD